ncbi:MAG: hypothetical protein IKH55_10570 [Fibrobacter sp.]|jgi:hypothetical protein|nr:hypothetical protein [Fibrobacter sp.]
MATSSITHNFVISPEGTQRFIDAMDRAEELASKPMRPLKGRILSSEADFLSLAEKIRSNER